MVTSRPFPYRKLIDFLKERHTQLYLDIVTGRMGTKDALAGIEAKLSIGETLDSPIPIEDLELKGTSKLIIYQNEQGEETHWLYWLGFWNTFCDEPFWPFHITKKELPLVVDIMQIAEMA